MGVDHGGPGVGEAAPPARMGHRSRVVRRGRAGWLSAWLHVACVPQTGIANIGKLLLTAVQRLRSPCAGHLRHPTWSRMRGMSRSEAVSGIQWLTPSRISKRYGPVTWRPVASAADRPRAVSPVLQTYSVGTSTDPVANSDRGRAARYQFRAAPSAPGSATASAYSSASGAGSPLVRSIRRSNRAWAA